MVFEASSPGFLEVHVQPRADTLTIQTSCGANRTSRFISFASVVLAFE